MPMKLNISFFFFFFLDNNLHEMSSGAAEYSPNFWRTSHRKHFAGFIELHLLFKGIQIRGNFPADIKKEFPGDAVCARPVPAASLAAEPSQSHTLHL